MLLWVFWLKRGHYTEGRAWLERVKALDVEIAPVLRAEVRLGAGSPAAIQGDFSAADHRFSASLALWREAGSSSGIARTLAMASIMAIHAQEFERAAAMLTEAMPLFELPIFDEPWAAYATGYLGFSKVGLGDVEAGVTLAEQGLARLQASGEEWATANALVMLGDILESRGEHRRAATVLTDPLERWSAPGVTGVVVWPLVGLARVASVAGDPIDAARLLGYLDAIAIAKGSLADPYFQQLATRVAASARARLGDRDFDIERTAGRETPPDQIVHESLRIARGLGNVPYLVAMECFLDQAIPGLRRRR